MEFALPAVFTSSEAARRLGISAAAAGRLIESGDVSADFIGGRWLLNADDIDALTDGGDEDDDEDHADDFMKTRMKTAELDSKVLQSAIDHPRVGRLKLEEGLRSSTDLIQGQPSCVTGVHTPISTGSEMSPRAAPQQS